MTHVTRADSSTTPSELHTVIEGTESIDSDSISEESFADELEKEPDVEGKLKIKQALNFENYIYCCHASNYENLLLIGFNNGKIELYDSAECKPIGTLEDSSNIDKSVVTSLHFLENESIPIDFQVAVSTYVSGNIKFWDLESMECIDTIKEDQKILSSAVDLNYMRLITVGTDTKVKIYDLQKKQLLNTLEGSLDTDKADGHTMRIFAVKCHPQNKNELLTGGWDNTIQIWDDRCKHAVRRIYGPHICGDGIDILNDQLLTASWQKTKPLQVWEYKTGKKIRDINPDTHFSYLYCCQWIDTNLLVAGGSNANICRVVDCLSWVTMGSVTNIGPVYSLSAIHKVVPTIFVGSAKTCYIVEVVIKEKEKK